MAWQATREPSTFARPKFSLRHLDERVDRLVKPWHRSFPFGAHLDGAPLRAREKTTMKRTYQPHKVSRLRTHGFRARMATKGGRKVINARRRKGRARLAPGAFQK